jgi:ABC-2 type transport system permease protein
MCSPSGVVDPAPLRPLVQYQPLFAPVEAMRMLALGRSATTPLLITAGWVLVLTAVFAPLAVRGYRKAAETAAMA